MGRFKYGWKKQKPDKRDRHFSVAQPTANPDHVDHRSSCPGIYDQGQYGSCTANAAAGAFEFDLIKQGLPSFQPSRMFQYYNTRVLDGDVGYDGGGTIRNANKALAKWGTLDESLWQYTDPHLLQKPTKPVYKAALPDAITAYMSVNQDIESIKTTLASGFPIQIGFTVFESFESQEASITGIIPMPAQGEQELGGHAVLIVGYYDSITVRGQALSNMFVVRNSWGPFWGDKGYFYMPYEYFLDPNLASDLWVINAVPGGNAPTPPPPDPTPSPCPPCPPPPCIPNPDYHA